MGDGFYRSKDPTNSVKVLKERSHISFKGTRGKCSSHNAHALCLAAVPQNCQISVIYNVHIAPVYI